MGTRQPSQLQAVKIRNASEMTSTNQSKSRQAKGTNSIKHTKITLFGQVLPNLRRLNIQNSLSPNTFFVLVALAFLLAATTFDFESHAAPLVLEDDLPIGLVPRPQGDTKVALTAYTVDLTFEEKDNSPHFTVVVKTRLHNPSTVNSASIVLDLRGKTNTGAPISGLRLAEGQDATAAVPYAETSYIRTLRPDERMWLTFVYTDELSDIPWSKFQYNLDALNAWQTTVGSVRFTFHLPQGLTHTAFLRVAPDPSRFDTQRLEWQWEELTPQVPIDILFIRPQIWQYIETLRHQIMAGTSQATETLAQLLSDIIMKEGAPEEAVDVFYPEALALWTKIARERPQDPQPWRMLANLYALRAAREADPETYRSLIINALENAWQRGDRSDYVRTQLATVVRSQLEHLVEQQRWQEALEESDYLRDLLGPTGEDEVKRLRQKIALAWAQNLLRRGDENGIREALIAGWGPAVVSYFLPQRPSFAYLHLDIQTRERNRTVVITTTFDPHASPSPKEGWTTWIRAMQRAVPRITATQEDVGNSTVLTLTIPFVNASDLQDAQRRIVDTVPSLPEWAFIRDALSPVRLQYEQTNTLWGKRIVWEEEVDSTTSRQTLDEVISTLKATTQTPLLAEYPQELSDIRKALRQGDIRAWEELRDTARATYNLEWSEGLGPPSAHRWQLKTGEQTIMRASRTVIEPGRAILLAGALLLFWTGLTLLLWHTLGRG